MKALAAFLVSVITRRPVVWGVAPVITVEPTNHCNLSCPFCVTGNGSMERPGGRMSLDTFKRVVDEIGHKIWYVILYHQGEPYLNKSFLDCVAYAKSYGLYTETSTNAHYLTEKNAVKTIESGLDAMIVSVDGTTQDSYARYRVRGNLDKVVTGIRTLTRAKERLGSKTPYVLLQFLVMRHNEHELADIENLARDLKVDRLLKKNIQVESHSEALEWMPKNPRFQRYQINENDIQVRRGGKGTCPRPWLSSLVNWDGSIVPCCFDKNGQHKMGPPSEDHRFMPVWQNGQYSQFRKQMLENRDEIDICKNCNQGFGVWV